MGIKVCSDNNRVIVSGVECLNLELTLDCGQAFRWKKCADGSFCGVAANHMLRIRKDGENFVLENTDTDIFDSFWKNYFDFEKDYKKICDTLMGDDLVRSTIKQYYGIRILNQDSWEALCSFVISQQNNIKRIKLIIERLCAAYGEDIGQGMHAFPTPERLAQLSAADFETLGAGYRAKYLERLSKGVAEGSIDLDKIKKLPLEDARRELTKIYGVGEKVANCTLLFGMGFYSAFPLDVWMKRVMEYYPNGLPECFKGYEGVAQQYLFHWARNNLK